jgi:hypothetical protein
MSKSLYTLKIFSATYGITRRIFFFFNFDFRDRQIDTHTQRERIANRHQLSLLSKPVEDMKTAESDPLNSLERKKGTSMSARSWEAIDIK